MEDDLAAGRLVELQDRAAGRGLAAAGLADQAERLALLDLEGDAVDGLDRADLALEDDALGEREVHDQVVDFQEGVAASRSALVEIGDRPWLYASLRGGSLSLLTSSQNQQAE